VGDRGRAAEAAWLCRELVERALAVTGSRFVSLCRLDRADKTVAGVAWAGRPRALVGRAVRSAGQISAGFEPTAVRFRADINPLSGAVHLEGRTVLAPFAEVAAGTVDPQLVHVAGAVLALKYTLALPLNVGGEVVGSLAFHSRRILTRRERCMAEAFAHQAALTLENARLHADLLARVDELRRSRARILEAAQSERRRLERDLHDGAQQRLVTLALELGRLEARLGSDPDAREALAQARAELGLSLAELRELARGIHPAIVTGHGLAAAVESVAARAPVPVELRVDLDSRLPEPIEVAAYFLVSEGLTNVAKYAHASAASVVISRTNDDLVVEVSDDGVGGADAACGSGLRGLTDRVEALGGCLAVESPVGSGTRMRAQIPCA
jgi:signal transduction histidine kinase